MSVKDLHPIDLDLKLLKGDPIYTGNIAIKPLILKEIIDFGYMKYTELLGVLTVKASDLISGASEEFKEKFKDYTSLELIIGSGNDSLIGTFVNSLELFLRKKILTADERVGLIFGDENDSFDNQVWVNKDNFDEIVEIVRHQNYLKKSSQQEKADFNPKDDVAKELNERMSKYRAIVEQKKANQAIAEGKKDSIEFNDIVSAVSTKSNSFNKFNIWDATIYQIYDEYKRLETISGYEIGISAMMQGAKIDLKHWSSKM